MRVAHICQSDDPNVGGSLTVARALVREQRQQGLDAHLLCLYESGNSIYERATEPHTRLLNVSRRARWSRGIPALRACLDDLTPQVIHHHDGILWPRVATLRLSVPLVTHGHLGRPARGPFTTAYWTHRFVAARTDRLVAISEWVAASWAEGGFPRSKIKVIPNGVDTDRFFVRDEQTKLRLKARLGLPTNRSILLWVGRLDRVTKGLDRLVTIARGLDQDCQVVVIGDGPDREWLALQVSGLPDGRRPILAGKVEDPSPYFGAADAFLFTSRVEPFGLVILESAASRLPVFAFPCEGGAVELLRRCKAVTLPENPPSGMLARILADRGDRDELVAVWEDICQHFSWKATATAIAKVYGDLVAGV